MDTWDPHEPWDAPPYYTELYWPDYDGELVLPLYGNWHDVPGYEEATLRKGHATYCGEITMGDTWLGFLLRPVENMGLTDRTTVIFTTDHGFYFGEHGSLFGKMNSGKSADGTLRPYGEPGSTWTYSPLFEELVHIPLLIKVPGLLPGRFQGLSSVVDVMPTVLDLMGLEIRTLFRAGPLRRGCGTGQHGEGRSWSAAFPSPTPAIRSIPWTTCCAPFRIIRSPRSPLWSLLYSPEDGVSELYHLPSDPGQVRNVIGTNEDIAGELHQFLVRFMRDTRVPERLLTPRLELRI